MISSLRPDPRFSWTGDLGASATSEVEVRRSRFISHLARCTDETAARSFIDAVRHRYPDARHHCSAHVVPVTGQHDAEHSSDDGEPAGTAGMPMLEVLRGSGLSNVVAVVTRYFGGVLLGTGGLVRAYSDSVAAAVSGTPRVRPVVRRLVGLEVDAAEAGRVQGALMNRGVDVVEADWGGASVLLTLSVDDPEAALPLVREIAQADVGLVPLGEKVHEVRA